MGCIVEGCLRPVKSSGLCSRHYERQRLGKPLTKENEPRMRGTGSTNAQGYVVICGEYAHRLAARKVLGRSLMGEECVHHWDENPANNNPDNLVICPNKAYHELLHRRMRALKSRGNANWLRCQLCGNYEDPKSPDMWVEPKGRFGQHRSCGRAVQQSRRDHARRNAR